MNMRNHETKRDGGGPMLHRGLKVKTDMVPLYLFTSTVV